ncbi:MULTISPECIES: Nif11-like leader peptide family natural product precursor [unclassified Prochlorococcus]|uniref:Nif11-like leader peptide family natural product precursor n=1 Tax=unclassified Prochlorococcus TaxID=2627481 RepID=UPI000907871B
MTREGLSNLLHAAEHSLSLRSKLKNCSNYQELIDIATDYGFTVKLCDFQNEVESQRIEDWFRNSKISPIRK